MKLDKFCVIMTLQHKIKILARRIVSYDSD